MRDNPVFRRWVRSLRVRGLVTALALGKALLGTGMADYIAVSFVGMTSALPVPSTSYPPSWR